MERASHFMAMGLEKIGFGGGCHWCTEAVFQALAGVESVAQGFIKSRPPHDSFSEAVVVTFDPERIAVSVLVDIHMRTHASTSAHAMRGKYRSAVYTFDGAQSDEVSVILATAAHDFAEPLVTQVLPFAGFRASDARFQGYYVSGPDRPFCRTYIDPKLKLLREEYADRLR